MIGVVGGLLAAVLWGASGVVGANVSRRLGARQSLGWVYLVALVVVAPVALVSGGLPELSPPALGWLAAAIVGAVASLVLMYVALARGSVVVVMPVLSLQGAVAAMLAVALGESLRPEAALALGACAAGTVAVVWRKQEARAVGDGHRVAVAAAAASALLSGAALVGTAHAGHDLNAPWLLTLLRLAGVAALTVPLALRGRLPRPGAMLPRLVFCGLADLTAFASYLIASRHGIAIPAVISSQFAAVSVLIGVVWLGERLGRVQWAGVGAIMVGVALVTAIQG